MSKSEEIVTIPVVIDEEQIDAFSTQDNPARVLLPAIKQLAASGLEVSAEELFAYSLYVESMEEDGWRTYKDMQRKLPGRRNKFDDYISTENNRARLKRPPAGDITESMGVGATLAASTRILGVANADFVLIPITSKTKSLDFNHRIVASDGASTFQVEAKGCTDGKNKDKRVRSIVEKKIDVRDSVKGQSLVGMVFDISHTRNKGSTLYIYDPPSNDEVEDPRFVRVVTRMKYYLSELLLISAGRLATALANRIKVLEVLGPRNWNELDGVPLLRPDSEELRVPKTVGNTIQISSVGRRVRGSPHVHGRLIDLRLTKENREKGIEFVRKLPQRLYFRGLHRKVLTTLARQNFDQIAELNFSSGFLRAAADNLEGRVLQLQSGLVSGIVRDSEWDRDVLRDLFHAL